MTPSDVVARFHRVYPSSAAPRLWRAPGRVNLIGEHTDYNLGLVLPMAIDLVCYVAAAPNADGCLRVYSAQLAEGSQWPVDDLERASPRGDWSDRVAGIAWVLAQRGVTIAPQNVLIDSSVPLGGGLSSSAALGVALALALGGPSPPLKLAKLARMAETEFVGVPCGIMDQFAVAQGVEGAGILLDCRDLSWRPVRLPAGVAVVAANTMVRHELASSAYRTRVEECGRAARSLGLATLRDATEESLDELGGVEFKRARHVVTENARVEAFAKAAAAGELEAMGRLLLESHVSLRNDYEVSSAELDFLVEAALAVPGVLGARMTGGGFGGCTVNLVRAEAVEELRQVLQARYQEAYARTPETHICVPSGGAAEVFT
jgi:galactokinase